MIVTERKQITDFRRHFHVTARTIDGLPAFTVVLPFPDGKNEPTELTWDDFQSLRTDVESEIEQTRSDEWVVVGWKNSITVIVEER